MFLIPFEMVSIKTVMDKMDEFLWSLVMTIPVVQMHKEESLCSGDNDVNGQVSQSPNGEYFDLDVGDEHACAIDFSGKIVCWGDNSFGEAGDSACS